MGPAPAPASLGPRALTGLTPIGPGYSTSMEGEDVSEPNSPDRRPPSRFRLGAESLAARLRQDDTRARAVREARAVARAEGEARVVLERAQAAAVAARQAIVEEARSQALYEAQQIRREAEQDVARLREEAAAAAGRLSEAAPVTAIHSAEIGAYEFPPAFRGYERAAVRRWLGLVELSHALLEQELDRARTEWGRALEALRVATHESGRARAAGELERSAAALDRTTGVLPAGTVGAAAVFEGLGVRAQLLGSSLSHSVLGYDRGDVNRLLESAAAHIARLEAQLDLLRADNARLRARLLADATDRGPATPPPADQA
jgi:vacuolar-type H+-ATPase subunit H